MTLAYHPNLTPGTGEPAKTCPVRDADDARESGSGRGSGAPAVSRQSFSFQSSSDAGDANTKECGASEGEPPAPGSEFTFVKLKRE